jgi:hypothetical protein
MPDNDLTEMTATHPGACGGEHCPDGTCAVCTAAAKSYLAGPARPAEVAAALRGDGFTVEGAPSGAPFGPGEWLRRGQVRVVIEDAMTSVYVFGPGSRPGLRNVLAWMARLDHAPLAVVRSTVDAAVGYDQAQSMGGPR